MSPTSLRLLLALPAAVMLTSCASAGRPSQPPVAPRPEVDVAIDRVLEAYGGRERLARATTRRDEGRVVARSDGREGRVLRALRRPDHLRVEIHYADHTELRILGGLEGWRGDGRGPAAAVKGPMLDAMALQAARIDLPWLLASRRAEARIGKSSDDATWVVEVMLAPGLGLTAVVDRATGHIVRSVTSAEGPGATLSFATDYADFRSVDGVLVPFTEENFASGTHTATTTLERVELGGALGDELFRP